MENKIKASLFCYSCCTDENDDDVQKVLQLSDQKHHHLHVSLATWLKAEIPEIKERCASIFSGKFGKNRHRGNSAEFRYDPMSYALNFEDDESRIDEYPLRNFSARLPHSPPNPSSEKKNVVVSREIAAWS